MSLLALSTGHAVQLTYMLAALLFIFGMKKLSGVKTSRQGNLWAALAMLIAIVATLILLYGSISLWVVVPGLLIGGGLGLVMAKRVPLTAMPELVAFFNGMGGAASMVVALAEITRFAGLFGEGNELPSVEVAHLYERFEIAAGAVGGGDFAVAIVLSILIGAVTLSGSLIAFGKLSGKIKGSRIGPLGSRGMNILLALACISLAIVGATSANAGAPLIGCMLLLTLASLALGIGLVVPIGGADMPVVISLLNSYSGLAASATGFVLQNNLLITAGSLVGAAGLILTRIMCKAMNRSLTNVLFGGFGEDAAAADDSGYTNVKSTSADELAPILDAARSVIFVPGYGLAVAQAQHKVRELATLLADNDCEVRYAIHPVAGRMPGHMNVLLAEADVPYEQLFDLDQINDDFKNTDVAIVLGANDVCNPAASDPTSAIAGMPVLDVWDARTVIVIKRSLSPGYAGIKNGLFEMDNCLMLFADAKKALEDTITELKDY